MMKTVAVPLATNLKTDFLHFHFFSSTMLLCRTWQGNIHYILTVNVPNVEWGVTGLWEVFKAGLSYLILFMWKLIYGDTDGNKKCILCIIFLQSSLN